MLMNSKPTKGSTMRNKKIHYSLSPEAIAVIDKRAYSPNKRGEWISNALVEYDRILTENEADGKPEDPTRQIIQRLVSIEKKLSAFRKKVNANA